MDNELFEIHGKISATCAGLRSFKDSFSNLSDSNDQILWGYILILEDTLPKIYEIKQKLE